MNIRRQAKMLLYILYLKKQRDWDMIHEENNIIKIPEEVASTTNEKLRQGKCICLVIRTEHPIAYEVH